MLSGQRAGVCKAVTRRYRMATAEVIGETNPRAILGIRGDLILPGGMVPHF
ncbi:MAG: hypothetical protein H6R11_447 [Proteobacteria bacterium]|nr:hypothetical protein [Pseudomonadota bacterium]MBS1172819.1 hypothetical protein [Pseudomonadota bacterium]